MIVGAAANYIRVAHTILQPLIGDVLSKYTSRPSSWAFLFKLAALSICPNMLKYAQIVPYAPLKINMEHSHGGLEDHFPF